MAKRLFDTEIWQKEWFGELPIKLKALVFYIFGNCDCAGVFEANYRNLKFYIGDKICEKDILNIKQIVKLPNGKFFLTDFIKFQYGVSIEELNPKFSVHKGVIKILEKNGILGKGGECLNFETVTEGLGNGYNVTAQNKDKDKNKDKDNNITSNKEDETPKKTKKEKPEAVTLGEFNNVVLSTDEIAKLEELYKDRFAPAIEILSSYIASSGKKYKSHYAVLGKHNWVYKKTIEENKGMTNPVKDKSLILRQVNEAF